MRLLFEQNISFRILKKIENLFPNSEHTKRLNLDISSDLEIWHYAKKNDFCIVTFDSDFIDLSLVKGFPPKIIWLRSRNNSTNFIAEIIKSNHANIEEFLMSTEFAFLELT